MVNIYLSSTKYIYLVRFLISYLQINSLVSYILIFQNNVDSRTSCRLLNTPASSTSKCSSILYDDTGGVLPGAGSDEKVSCPCNQVLLIHKSFHIESIEQFSVLIYYNHYSDIHSNNHCPALKFDSISAISGII